MVVAGEEVGEGEEEEGTGVAVEMMMTLEVEEGVRINSAVGLAPR